MSNSRYEQVICRNCSDRNYPEFRYFLKTDNEMTCTNCGQILAIRPTKKNPKITYLEVIKNGR